jgi:hypothetical protein
VLWENGIPTTNETLGGEFWHTPMAINARGDDVGFSNPPGGGLAGNDVLAVIPWALVHGLAMLAVAGQLPGNDALHIEVLAMRATDVLYEGMAADFLSRPRADGGPGR